MKAGEILAINEMYIRHGYKCFVCAGRATQRAHIIGDTDVNRSIYGNAIIDNPLDWLPACNLRHNGLIDVSKNIELAREIASLIVKGKRGKIEKLVRKNIVRKTKKSC